MYASYAKLFNRNLYFSSLKNLNRKQWNLSLTLIGMSYESKENAHL